MRAALLLAIAASSTGCAPAAMTTVTPTPEAPAPEAPAPEEPPPPAQTPERATPWSIVYADGSANVSRIAHQDPGAPVEYVYEPVTPETSSSGTYSGGDPRSERIASGDPRIDALWREVERLEADTTVHVKDRAKGTGAFAITTPQGERAFIVKGGVALEEIGRILAGFGAP